MTARLRLHIGEPFEKWTVIDTAVPSDRWGKQRVLCQCQCGRQQTIPATQLHQGNRLLTLHGETAPLITWAERYHISPDRLRGRLNLGWDLEEALTMPLHSRPTRPRAIPTWPGAESA